MSIALIGQTAELRHYQQTVKLTSVGATDSYLVLEPFTGSNLKMLLQQTKLSPNLWT
jgi:hypothetical protein